MDGRKNTHTKKAPAPVSREVSQLGKHKKNTSEVDNITDIQSASTTSVVPFAPMCLNVAGRLVMFADDALLSPKGLT